MAMTFQLPGIRGSWRRAALVSLAVLLCAGTVVALVRGGPSSGTSDSSGDFSSTGKALRSSPATTVVPVDEQAARPAGVPGATATGTEDPAVVPPSSSPIVGPQIVRTADLTVRIKRGGFDAAVERATSVASAVGGFVADSSTSSLATGSASGELTLRVPAARFDDVRRSLAGLGTLEAIDLGGNDVGGQLVDLDARLRTLKAEEGSLDVLLGRAGDIGQILQVRDRLTAVRTEIEQLGGQQAALRDQVALATVHVSLHEAGAKRATPARHHGRGFTDAFGTATDALLAVVGGMVIALGASLPFLLLALLAWVAARRYGRRHAAQAR